MSHTYARYLQVCRVEGTASAGNDTPVPFITANIHNLLKIAQPRCVGRIR